MRNPPRNRDRFGILEVYPGSDFSADEIEFMVAMDRYKRLNQRPFPSWPEVLAVAHACGWQRVAPDAKEA